MTAYRRLVAARTERPARGLLGALRTYALVLGACERTAESVTVYEECAVPLRSAPLRDQGRLPVARARVLSELGAGLRALGRHEEALTVGQEEREATDRFVVRLLPDLLRPLRLRLLMDLDRCHEATGDLPTARTTAAEAVTEDRTPAGGDPVTRPSASRLRLPLPHDGAHTTPPAVG